VTWVWMLLLGVCIGALFVSVFDWAVNVWNDAKRDERWP